MGLPELLSSIVGIVISLAFEYIPGVKDWYDSLEKPYKALFMVGIGALVSIGFGVVSCLGWFLIVPCTQAGIFELVRAFIAFMVANQGTYLVVRNKFENKGEA